MAAAAGPLAVGGPDLNKFGGRLEKSFEASGFFRIEKDDLRCWHVTPEGHGFLIHGMDHVGRHTISQPYNKQHWDKELEAVGGRRSEASGEHPVQRSYVKTTRLDSEKR